MVTAFVRRLPLRRGLSRVAVGLVVVGLAIAIFRVLVDRWTAAEAWAVGGIAGLLGSAEVTRSGHQLLVQGDAGTFVLTVSAWCSSLVPVLGVAALAVLAPGDRRRRRRAALSAIVLLVVGNVARVAAVVVVGADLDVGRLEPFHDGPATAFTVVLVLSAATMLAWSTLPARSTLPLRAPVRPRRAPR
ncbi:MAG: hypothetical protein NTZ21_16105 [Actinobacteria bacterium]|nr:hypothetical protein [Actinomycetota bacterium]